MNKVIVKVFRAIGSAVNVLFNPFYSIMSITERKRDHDENDNKLSTKLLKIVKNNYFILFISLLLTMIIIFTMYHKEILGI